MMIHLMGLAGLAGLIYCFVSAFFYVADPVVAETKKSFKDIEVGDLLCCRERRNHFYLVLEYTKTRIKVGPVATSPLHGRPVGGHIFQIKKEWFDVNLNKWVCIRKDQGPWDLLLNKKHVGDIWPGNPKLTQPTQIRVETEKRVLSKKKKKKEIDLEVIPKAELEALHDEIESLKTERAERNGFR